MLRLLMGFMMGNEDPNTNAEQNKPASDDAKKREIDEKNRQEAIRLERLRQELKAEAIERQKQDELTRSEQQKTKVEPIVLENKDGSFVSKDDLGRIRETVDVRGQKRIFGYNEKGELNSFTDEKGNHWATTDGQHWQGPDQKSRTMHALINPADGTLAILEAKVATTRLNEVTKTDGRITQATDLDGRKRTFTYDEKSGAVNGFTDEKGKQWNSEDGKIWKSEGEQPRALSVSVDSADGSLNVAEAGSTEVQFLNGKTMTRDRNGIVVRDQNGNVVETKVKEEGPSNTFVVEPNGKLDSITLASGQQFSTTDGVNYTSATGDKIRNAKVDGQGVLTYVNAQGDVLKVGPTGEPQVVITRAALEKSADAIAYAMNGGIGAGTDRVTMRNELNSLDETAREELRRLWTEKHNAGVSNYDLATLDEEFVDEMSGSELSEMNSLLYRKDGKADVVGRVNTALTELSEYYSDHDRATDEKNIRELIGTQNSEQLQKLQKEYGDANNNQSFSEKVLNDPNLSAATKEALPILLKGVDKRTDADTQALVEIALKNRNMDLLQESLRNSTPAARQALQDSNVSARILTAFGQYDGETGTTYESSQTMIANDYAKNGKLTVASEIRLNTSALGDNEKAIDTALGQMSDQERQLYIRGRELSVSTADPSTFSQQDKDALANYQDIQNAMKGAGNQWELNRWEGFIVNSKEQSDFLSRIYANRGVVYNSSVQAMSETIEEMPKDVWIRLKQEQKDGKSELRDQITKAFDSYNTDDATKKQLQTIIDAKLKFDDFDEAKKSGRRDVDTALKDALGIDNDERAGLKVLQNMTEDEQKRYRSDDQFRKNIDDRVVQLFDEGSERDAANLILKRIYNGQSPNDILVDLATYSQDTYVNEAEVVRKVSEAFRKDPKLHERIANPQTPEDVAYSEQFKTLLYSALGNNAVDNDGEVYGKDLIETGKVNIGKRMYLNMGDFDDDEKSCYNDILYADAEETKKLLTDPTYQEAVMPFLSKEEREVAINNLKERERLNENQQKLEQQLNELKETDKLPADKKEAAIKQLEQKIKDSTEHLDKFFAGEMRPEDAMRAASLGAGTDEDWMKTSLGRVAPDQMDDVRNSFASKYGQSMVSQASDELGGQDLSTVLRMMRPDNTTQEEDFTYALDEYSNSRGFGANFVRAAWDGTADQTDKSFNDFASRVSEANRYYDELSPEERKDAIEKLEKRVEDLIESKEALGDIVADVLITAVAIGGCALGNPETLGLLAFTTFAGSVGLTGAVLKVAVKAAIMGNNYTSDMLYTDLASGFVDAGLNVLGPAQIGKLFKVGAATAEKTASELAEKLIARNLLKTVSSKGATVLVEGSTTRIPAAVLKETDELVMHAMISGAKEFDEKAVTAAARKMVDKEIGETAFQKALSENLGKKAAEQARNEAINKAAEPIAVVLKESLTENVKLSTKPLVRYATNAVFEGGGGALGGGAGGFTQGVIHYDTSKSLEENIKNIGQATLMSAILGGAAGAGAGTLFKGAGETIAEIKAAKTASEELNSSSEQALRKFDDTLEQRVSSKSSVVEPENEISQNLANANTAERTKYVSIVPGERDQFNIWNKSFKPENHGPAEYQAAILKLKDYSLMTPEVNSSFVKEFRDVTEKWAAASGPKNLADKAFSEYNVAATSYLEMLDRLKKGGSYSGDDVNALANLSWDYEKFKALANTDEGAKFGLQKVSAEELRVVDEAIAKRSAYLEADALSQAAPINYNERVSDVQTLMNNACDKAGIPRNALVLLPDLGDAAGTYLDGRISIRESTFKTYGDAELASLIFHETVHSEQQFMFTRKMADDLGLVGDATENTAALRAEYRKVTGDELSETYAFKVLKARNDVPLTEVERASATELLKTWMSRESIPELYTMSQNTIVSLNSTIEKVRGEGGDAYFKGLMTSERSTLPNTLNEEYIAEKSRILMTFDEAAKEDWQRRLAQIEKEATENIKAGRSNDQVRERFASLFQEGTEHVNAWRQLELSRYAGQRHEWDAYWAGAVIERDMKERLSTQSSSVSNQVVVDPKALSKPVVETRPVLQNSSFKRNTGSLNTAELPKLASNEVPTAELDAKLVPGKREFKVEEYKTAELPNQTGPQSSSGTTGGSSSNTGPLSSEAMVDPNLSGFQSSSLSKNDPVALNDPAGVQSDPSLTTDPIQSEPTAPLSTNAQTIVGNNAQDLSRDVQKLEEPVLFKGASPGYARLEVKPGDKILVGNEAWEVSAVPYDRESGKLVLTRRKSLTPSKDDLTKYNPAESFTPEGLPKPGETYRVWRERKLVFEQFEYTNSGTFVRTDKILVDPSEFAKIAERQNISQKLGKFRINDNVTIGSGEGKVVGFDGGDVLVRTANPNRPVSYEKIITGSLEDNGFRSIRVDGYERVVRDESGQIYLVDSVDQYHVLRRPSDLEAVNHAGEDAPKALEMSKEAAVVPQMKPLEAPLPSEEPPVILQNNRSLEAPLSPNRKLGYDSQRSQPVLEEYKDAALLLDGKRIELRTNGEGLSIGRLESNDVVLNGLGVSRSHASIKWDKDRQMFYLVDSSANGCKVRHQSEVEFKKFGGEKNPTPIALRPGDEIQIGDSILRFDVPKSDFKPFLPDRDIQILFNGQKVEPSEEIVLGLNSPQLRNFKKGDVFDRVVSREHVKLKRDASTGKWVLTDTTKFHDVPQQQGTVNLVQGQTNGTFVYRQGTWYQLRGSLGPPADSIELIEGDIIKLGSQIGPELRITETSAPEQLLDGSLKFKRRNGDVLIKRSDGLQEFQYRAGVQELQSTPNLSYISDADGAVLRTTDRLGNSTTFGYGEDGVLNKITFADQTSAELREGKWFRSGDENSWFEGEITVENDGSIRYANENSITIDRLDGTREVTKVGGRTEYSNLRFSEELPLLRQISFNTNFFKTELEQTRFRQMLADFENNLKREFTARGLGHEAAEQELAQSMHHLRRMLESGDQSLLPQASRVELAEQFLNQANHPSLISQGENPTCNVTTVEQRIYTRNPSEAARLLSDVATTGRYVTSDGVLIDVARIQGSLEPDTESLRLFGLRPPNDLRLDGQRTYASQIFEQTAVNIKYHQEVGDSFFTQYRKVDNPLPGQSKHQLVEFSLNSNGVLQERIKSSSPNVSEDDLTALHNRISGKNDKNFVIQAPFSRTNGAPRSYNPSSTVVMPRDLQEFEQLLKNTDANDFPLIVGVSCAHPQFKKNPKPGDPLGHVMTVRGISERPPGSGKYYAELANQWRAEDNQFVPIADVWEIMLPAPQNKFRYRNQVVNP